MERYFKIGEIARLYNIGVDALRYYEKTGIIRPKRSESGYRLYSLNDIWRLNVIRDLREIGFNMEQIKEYMTCHNTASTLRLLEEEQTAIQSRMQSLMKLQENVDRRLKTIRAAQQQPLNQIVLKTFPARRCHSISESYTEAAEMDVLIKKLLNMDKDRLYVIGCNRIGTVIPVSSVAEGKPLTYQSVFMIDEKGEDLLPEGMYLCVTYPGDYSQSAEWCRRLLDYAKTHHLNIVGDVLEMLWIDIHVSSDSREHITQLQIRVEG